MRVETITCDMCGAQISVIHRSGVVEGEFCFECVRKATDAANAEACAHEDNASDQVSGRSTARLICKQCGYDRIVQVEEVA